MQNRSQNSIFLLTASILAIAAVAFVSTPSDAREIQSSVIVTQDDLPPGLKDKIYTKPARVQDIRPSDIIPRDYFTDTDTLVSRRIENIADNLFTIQGDLSALSGRLSRLQKNGKDIAVQYYANVATINTQLQSGTTPGNPRLINKLETAERSIEALSANIASLNELAVDAAHVSSEAAFLLEEARAAYGISGAVEEDHIHLAKLEDSINNTMVLIDRLLDTVNDDITRTSSYLNSERKNLRTLSLAVANGDLYGKNLTMRPFSSAPVFSSAPSAPASLPSSSQSGMPTAPAGEVVEEQPQSQQPAPQQQAAAPAPAPALSGPRPLAKIKFDKQNVDYEQPVYMAVSQALEKYPNSTFDLVAVHPSGGNAAQKAIESTRSRRNAERVLRTLTQMGLPLERINLSYNESDDAKTNEVHLYVR